MKVGIMQPYFFPYIGYWQLMNAVDRYVVYDDVNYINRGWINRNRILLNGEPKYLNLPMLGASQNKLINEIAVNNDKKIVEKNLRLVESAYKKAPYFSIVYPMIEQILCSRKARVAEYIIYSIYVICDYLDITTEIIISSSLEKDNNLRGQDKILSICQLLEATEYYNAIGGKDLYSYKKFQDNGIQLKFLNTDRITYEQFQKEFIPNLSIIDVMMFNEKECIKDMLTRYNLIEE